LRPRWAGGTGGSAGRALSFESAGLSADGSKSQPYVGGGWCGPRGLVPYREVGGQLGDRGPISGTLDRGPRAKVRAWTRNDEPLKVVGKTRQQGGWRNLIVDDLGWGEVALALQRNFCHTLPMQRVGKRELGVIVELDGDGYDVASVPELPGCHTQARSLEKRIKRVREAIELCLEVEEEWQPTTEFVGMQRITV